MYRHIYIAVSLVHFVILCIELPIGILSFNGLFDRVCN